MSTIYEQLDTFLTSCIENKQPISTSRARQIRAFMRLQQQKLTELTELTEQSNLNIHVMVIDKDLLYDEKGIDLDHLGKMSWEKDDEE